MMRYQVFSAVLLAALLSAVALFVEFRTDVSDFFFQADNPETAMMVSHMQTGALSRRYLLLVESPDEADLVTFTQELKEKLLTLPHIQRVVLMQQDEATLESLVKDYLPYSAALFSLSPQEDVPLLFSQASLDQRSEYIKTIILNQQYGWLQPWLVQDPLLLMSDWTAKLTGLQVSGAPADDAQFDNEEPQYTGLTVETSVSGLDSAKQQPIYQALSESFSTLAASYPEKISLRMTGVPVFAMAIKQQVSQDVKRVSLISSFLMIVLFLVVFKSLRGLLWVAFILISSVAAASLMTSLVFGYMHALVVAIGTTLIGVCIDYPIHSMVHAAASPKEDAEASTKQIWPSLWLGGLTTVVGYVALSFSHHPGMQQLALFAGVGIATSLLLTRFMLPKLMQAHIQKVKVVWHIQPWLALVERYRKPMQVLVLVFTMVVVVIAWPQFMWTDDMGKLSPALATLKANDQDVRAHLSSVEPGRFVLVKAADFETALQRNEEVAKQLQALKNAGDVTAYYSLYPWLASQKIQQNNLDVFTTQLTAEHQRLWQQSLQKQGLSVEKLGKFKAVSLQILTPEVFETLNSQPELAGQYLQEDGQALMFTWLGMHDVEKVKEKLLGLQGVQYISQKDRVNAQAAEYRVQTIKVLSLGSIAILLLLVARFGSLVIAMNVLFPALVATLLVVSMWSLLGKAMGMLHLIGLLLVIAICVDYAIFTLENRAGSLSLTFQAILVSSMTTAIAFLSLGFADNPALQTMAWTVGPGVLLGFLLCPLLVKQGHGLKQSLKRREA